MDSICLEFGNLIMDSLGTNKSVYIVKFQSLFRIHEGNT